MSIKVQSVIILLLIGILTICFLWVPVQNVDTWLHLKCGELVWNERRLITSEIFTYTAFGQPWSTQAWLFQVPFYLLHDSFGMNGLIALRLFAGFLTFFFVYQTAYMLSENRWLSLLCSGLTFWIASFRFGEAGDRPAMFSTLLICILLYLLTGVHMERFSKKIYAWFFVIFPLWANIHNGLIVGLGMVFVFWLAQITFRLQDNSRAPKWYQREEILFPLLVLTVLPNPATYRILLAPLMFLRSLGQSTVAMRHMTETVSAFDPEALLIPEGSMIPYLIIAIGLAFSLVRRGIPKPYLFIVLVTALMAARATRFAGIFACVAAPLLAYSAGPIMARWKKSLVILISITVLFVGYQLVEAMERGSLQAQEERFLNGPIPSYTPNLMKFLNDNDIRGRVFNFAEFGANFIYFRGPREKVFFDTRQMGSDAFYRDYLRALSDPRAFEALSQRYGGFDYVILPTLNLPAHVSLHRYLWENPDWKLVYESHKGFVYLKNTKEFAGVIRKYGYDVPPSRLLHEISFLRQ